MTAYLCLAAFLHVVGVVVTIRTKPGAPRPPQPSAGVLMVALLVHFSLLIWTSFLLWGKA